MVFLMPGLEIDVASPVPKNSIYDFENFWVFELFFMTA